VQRIANENWEYCVPGIENSFILMVKLLEKSYHKMTV